MMRALRTIVFVASVVLGCSAVYAQHTMVMHSPESPESSCNKGWADFIEQFPTSLIGNLNHPTSTKIPAAQRYFDQGLTFYYGFDTVSAMRSFHQATVADPTFAMGYWGVALAAGGDLNIPIDDPCMKLAIAQSLLAQRYAPHGSAAEQIYIAAISKRYGTDASPTPLHRDPAQLSVAYMLAMRNAYERLYVKAAKRDPDVAALYVVSLMNLRPWLWWTSWGTKSNEIAIAIDVLEKALARPEFQHHLGLNHFYIHALEEGPNAEAVKALPSAKRLMEEAPERTPHLRHMPAHAFLHAGDWNGVVAANDRAVKADHWWVPSCLRSQTDPKCNPLLVGHYMSHDLLFLSVGFANQGQWDSVKKEASLVEENASRFIAGQPGLEHYLTTRTMMGIKFGDWDYVSTVKPPQANMPDPHSTSFCADLKFKLASSIWYAGQAMVAAEKGQSADDLLFAYNKAADCTTAANIGWGNNPASAILSVVHWRLLSRISLKRGNKSQAVEFARLAVEMEDLLNYDEPPGWYVYSRVTLGAALMLNNHAEEALETFDRNLDLHPNDSLSLYGKWQALLALRRPVEAKIAEQAFGKQWLNPGLQPNLASM